MTNKTNNTEHRITENAPAGGKPTLFLESILAIKYYKIKSLRRGYTRL